MSRRYSDPIQVTAADPGDPAEPPAPQSFIWRRRRYRVSTVLARWIEADQWWRLAGFGSGAGGAESVVWRVEATGRASPTGVYDLRCRTASGRIDWSLIRAHD